MEAMTKRAEFEEETGYIRRLTEDKRAFLLYRKRRKQ